MHCEISGSGEVPLVCVHGWGCESGQFAEAARLLAGDFRVYRPDLPGHGQTPLGDFVPGFEAYAAAVVEFVASHGLKRPVLLGHSMGGVLALMAARRVDARAIVNLDGSLPAAEKTLAAQAVIRGWLDEPEFRERLAGALREGFFLPEERDAQCDEIIRTMCSAPEAVLRFLPEKIHDIDPEKILSEVKAPVLYVGAAKPRFDLAGARALLPQLQYEHIAVGGHFLHIYQTARVVELTRSFAQAANVH